MAYFNALAAVLGQVRERIARLDFAASARAREDARLAEARRLDADEVGRRADEAASRREATARDGGGQDG